MKKWNFAKNQKKKENCFDVYLMFIMSNLELMEIESEIVEIRLVQLKKV